MIHIPVFYIENRLEITEKLAPQNHGNFGKILSRGLDDLTVVQSVLVHHLVDLSTGLLITICTFVPASQTAIISYDGDC